MLHLPDRWRSAAQARNAVARQLMERHFLRLHALALFAWTMAIGYLMISSRAKKRLNYSNSNNISNNVSI